MTKDAATELSFLTADLVVAVQEHIAAEQASREASSRETQAINQVNALQKKIDEFMAKVYNTAPTRSDWKQRDLRKEA